ncbi:hypothetical protein AgCh_017557 [Apium graveolens]
MAPKDLIIDGAKFVPNNYAANLNKAEAPSDLHFVQDFLANSEIGYALTQPQTISSQQVLTFWRTGIFDDGGATGTPSIVFEVNDVEHVVTPGAVCKALHLPEGCTFSTVEDPVLQHLMASLGYEKSLGKLGQLKRENIRKEWSFFFDCITKAFANKCSNFDAISIMSQQIGTYLKPSQTSQPSPSAHSVRPSSSKPKRTKTVPQTQHKRRRIVLRDESDSEEHVPVSEPVVVEAEKQRTRRVVSISSHSKETLEERVQPETTQDRLPTPPMSPVNEPVHTEDPGTSAEIDIHNLIVPEVMYLEAPPAQITPPTTPILDADFNEDIPTTPILNLDDENQVLEEADDADSINFDAANDEVTGEAAAIVDADAAGPSGHAPLQARSKADLVKKADEMLVNDDFKAQLRVTALCTRYLQGQHSTTHSKGEKVIKSKCKPIKTLKGKDDGKDDQENSGMGGGHGQGMDFESLKEEEARLKLEKVNPKSEASVVEKKIPKAKGIVIKERINPEATKAKSQMEIDSRSNGKEKVGEPVKVYVPTMDEEISDEDANLTLISRKISQTTSVMAQVVQSQDIVKDKLKETSDIAHVKPSKLLLPGFTKAKQTQPLKTATSGFEARVVTGKEARDKSGLGSADERRIQNTTNDPTSLSEPDDAANYLKTQIQRQKKLYSVKSDSTYFPKYRDHKGDIVEMKPNSAKIITTFLGYKAVELNLESDKAYLIRLDQDIRKARINDLRAAIFQIGEDTVELKNAKRRMVNELEYAERCLLKNYLRTTPDIKEISN